MFTPSPKALDFDLRTFRRNLVGRWSSSWEQGPHPTEEWVFKPDGMGTYSQYSGSGHEFWKFCWKEANEFVIAVRFDKDEDGFPEVMGLENAEGWAQLAYRFVANHYVGVPALVLPICFFTATDEYSCLVSLESA